MRRTPALLALALALPAPALALTPDELWQAWQDQAAGWGATLSATATPGADGSLALSDLALAAPGGAPVPLPPEAPVRSLTLRLEGDAVLIDLGLPPLLRVPPADEFAPEVAIGQEGLELRAGGAPGAILYDLSVPRLTVGAFTPETEFMPGSSFALDVRGLALGLPGQLDAEGRGEARLSADSYATLQATPDLMDGDVVTTASEIDGRLALTAAVTVPPGTDLAALTTGAAWAQALAAGLGASITVETEEMTGLTRAAGWPFAYELSQATRPSSFTLSADGTGVFASGGYAGGEASLTLPDQGMGPFDLRYGPISADFALPLSATPAEFRYAVSMPDLLVDPAAWDALDPAGHIPRGPLRLVLDVGGRAAVDLSATLAAADAGSTPPVPTIESLEIRALDVAAVGVAVTGDGAFTFEGEGESQRPVGRAEVTVTGLDVLIDGLVAAGWIAATDAQQARLGLAFAFRAGDAPDTRVMRVEAKGAAGITVNGTPLPMP